MITDNKKSNRLTLVCHRGLAAAVAAGTLADNHHVPLVARLDVCGPQQVSGGVVVRQEGQCRPRGGPGLTLPLVVSQEARLLLLSELPG